MAQPRQTSNNLGQVITAALTGDEQNRRRSNIMEQYEPMKLKRERSIVEALDECTRELHVRERCFPRWIKEGRVSETDAQDRLDRLATACDLLTQLKDKANIPVVAS